MMTKMAKTLERTYDPKPVEEKWSRFWLEERINTPEVPSSKPKFSLALPPPNVTGSLHMGHALCFTLPDIIARWRRMKGDNVLWLPGTDHASIAVHNVIEQSLAEKGLSREKLGREEFLKMAWNWKGKYGGIITTQLKRLGASLDWTRERFTMDEKYSRAVQHVFVSLYNDGLVYRDYYLVNRCPRCNTVLSDIEIEHRELQGKLFHIKYPLLDGEDGIIVATTRPETMLGDTAVAVHPEDERYRRFQGKTLLLPLANRRIPVIVDGRVEKEFGTGAVKVTPAHDPVDFELGKEHNLEQVIVIDGSGRMAEAAGPEFRGLDRFECRKKVLERLQEMGLLVKVEDYQHMVGHCSRCKTIIEPHLSWQWFVRMAPLAKEAIRVVEDGTIEFIPANWAKNYFEWMYNIHDWCISRQLWWGHRIPAWYCKTCGEIIVAMETPVNCSRCGNSELNQDEDVLDTWFSSALWPFATLGWPEETTDLATFYPTDLMATAFDIIFFWVARMIMMGLKFTGKIPFRQVFINGLVRDFRRRKMSKSEGNVIDPLEMIEKYGTDALRFTMAAMAIPGMDLSLSEERMAGYRAFANKVWNASRFVLMNPVDIGEAIDRRALTLADRWIRSRLAGITSELEEALGQYKFYEAAEKIYHFIWHEFCDWYIEMAKPALRAGNTTTKAVLTGALDHILRLLHPFMPFITEEIWQHLPGQGKSLALAAFPKSELQDLDKHAEDEMHLLQDIIVEIRTIRAESKIPPQRKIDIWLKAPGDVEKKFIPEIEALILALANGTRIELVDHFPTDKVLLKGVAGAWEVAIPLAGVIDLKAERIRLEREIKKARAEIEKLEARLQKKEYLERAPQRVIEEAKSNLLEFREKKARFEESLARLEP